MGDQQPSPFTPYQSNGTMGKVQRLSRKGVGPSGLKCGAHMTNARYWTERFKDKVKVQKNGCHEWTGCLARNGYGQLRRDGQAHYAHRLAWELETGRAPGEAYILHTCDNRRCVNPDHLKAGTFDDNMADMVAKRRQARGTRNGHAKLSWEQVAEIREATGTQRDIAQRYGVTPPLISMIRAGRIWRV